MNNEPVAYACQIVEADFDTSIIKIEMLDKDYKVSAGIKFLCNEYTHPAKTLTDEEIIDIACKSAIATTQIETDFGNASIEFARAILRKAQEK
jgi:hypothetical protein